MDFMRFYPDSLPSMTNADKKTRKIIHKIRELEVNMENCQIKRDMEKFIEEQARLGAAGGGLAKLAGERFGKPPEAGPTPQGLASILKRDR